MCGMWKVSPHNMQVWKGCCFCWAHSVRVDHEDNMWFIDVMDHKLYKKNRAGETLLTLGDGTL